MAVARPAIPRRSLETFIAALASGSTVKEACEAASVGKSTVYEYRDDDPAFAAAWDAAREERVDALVKEAEQRAMDRSDPYSGRLLQFLLKGYRRETFGERVEVNATIAAVTSERMRAVQAAAEADPEAWERVAAAAARQLEVPAA